jgi:hypothetical protein
VKPRHRLLLQLAAFALTLGLALATRADSPEPAPLRAGDLVFQTSGSSQSAAILAATGSPYTHVGLVVQTPRGLRVLEAFGPVGLSRWERFVERGAGKRVLIMRPEALDEATRARLFDIGKKYLGRPYDPLFLEGDDAIYCSELVWLVLEEAGLELSGWRTVGELNLDDRAVRALLKRRWRAHPRCKGADDVGACIARIRSQRLLPPGDLAADPRLRLVSTSYPAP